MEKLTINQILEQICKPGSIYDEIINNILKSKANLKGELISEIAISFLSNKNKIEEVYEKGYFKYYFISAIRNQVNSSTSSFYKETRLMIDEIPSNAFEEKYDDDIDKKIEEEYKYQLLEEALANTQLTWFELTCFSEYYSEGKTYRQLEKEMGTDHCLIYHNVKKAKGKLIDYIQNRNK